MKTKALFLLMFLVASLQSLQAKTLIVSDIDDTIKMTDVLGNKAKIVLTALSSNKAFAGMSELYSEMTKKGDTNIYYVSGSPRAIEFRLRSFLDVNHFPGNTNLFLKENLHDDTYAYKVATIKKLIEDVKPDKVILIGDDTEYDPEVYNSIFESNPAIVEGIYIRSVVNRELPAGIRSFISPMEIGGFEVLQGNIKASSLESVALGFINETNSSGIVLKKRYCPTEGRQVLEELKQKFHEESTVALFERTQLKIISRCLEKTRKTAFRLF